MYLPNTSWSDRIFLVLAVLTASFALWMHYGIYTTNITRAQWAVPAKHIRAHFKKGDAIGLVPQWALMGAEALQGLPVLFPEHLHKEDLSRYRRLWVLVAPRLGKWWFQRSFSDVTEGLRRRYWRRETHRFGPIELHLFALPPAPKPLYDFSKTSNLRRAEVGLETPVLPRKIAGCPNPQVSEVQWLRQWREKPGWFMGRGGYYFGRTIQEIDNTPRDCLWAHLKRCRILRVRYRDVPLKGRLVLEHGFTTATPRRSITPSIKVSGPSVELSVWANHQALSFAEVSQKQIWRKHIVDLSKHSFSQKKGSLEFRVRVPERMKERTGYCFRARLLPHTTTSQAK